MKKLIILFAALATSAGAANAKCGTGQLDGAWNLYSPGDPVSEVTINNGQLTIPGAPGPFPITQTKSCKVALVDGATTFRGTSEAIPSDSSRKPRSVVLMLTVPAELMFYLVRK